MSGPDDRRASLQARRFEVASQIERLRAEIAIMQFELRTRQQRLLQQQGYLLQLDEHLNDP
jgi:hypothetical protein